MFSIHIRSIIEKFKTETNAQFYADLEQESMNRRARNEARMEKIKQEMGEKWILHPSHMKHKLDEPRPV